MADRYPDHGDYGRDKNRGRFSRDERWSDDEDWRRRSRERQSFGGREEDDDDRRNYGYGQGGMRGQSYGGGGYRDRDEYDRSYGLEGSSYSQRGQRRYGKGDGYSGQSEGYRQQGAAGFGAYEEGGSFSQGRPGMGAQGYERTGQDFGGYSQGFTQNQGFGSEQSGSYLTRGGRREWGRHSGRGPKNYTRSDDRIREDVNDRLTDDPHLDASEIDVKVSNCEVTLTGTVDSREAKRRAEDCVESVSGVKNVLNNLRVQASSEDESMRTTTGGGKKNKAGGDGEQRIQ